MLMKPYQVLLTKPISLGKSSTIKLKIRLNFYSSEPGGVYLMQDFKVCLILLGMICFFVGVFSLTYLIWNVHHFVALAVLVVGLLTDIFGGLKILDRMLTPV